MWAVSDTLISRTIDGGEEWKNVSGDPAPAFAVMGISALDALRAWAVTYDVKGSILHTTDGGTNWTTKTQLDGEDLPGLFTVSFAPMPIPEPTMVGLSLLGLTLLVRSMRRRA